MTGGENNARNTALFDNLIVNTVGGPKPQPAFFAQIKTRFTSHNSRPTMEGHQRKRFLAVSVWGIRVPKLRGQRRSRLKLQPVTAVSQERAVDSALDNITSQEGSLKCRRADVILEQQEKQSARAPDSDRRGRVCSQTGKRAPGFFRV